MHIGTAITGKNEILLWMLSGYKTGGDLNILMYPNASPLFVMYHHVCMHPHHTFTRLDREGKCRKGTFAQPTVNPRIASTANIQLHSKRLNRAHSIYLCSRRPTDVLQSWTTLPQSQISVKQP